MRGLLLYNVKEFKTIAGDGLGIGGKHVQDYKQGKA